MNRTALIVGVLLLGCTVPVLSPEGAKVTVTANNQLTVGCTLLGQIKAPDINEVGDSKNELANKAADMKGNLVLLTRKVGVDQQAEVYQCPASTLAPRVVPQP
jgi:hypothetical protein